MSIGKDLTEDIADIRDHPPDDGVWPVEDDYAAWKAGHELTTRAFICSAPEFSNTPYCGVGTD